MILLISASRVARITGVGYQCLTTSLILIRKLLSCISVSEENEEKKD
jgi:hypothetical protein